eukprot:TRINITY_DN18253_c0_g1_i4.p1 TRINITY_DN18253_c0_g1~~TRINITY_DN18253_c0_g1_i4.p1  ORF type:complete len:172 (+),score=69.12 TRINITY_DN18253_c0_g1_i4:79-594(+)
MSRGALAALLAGFVFVLDGPFPVMAEEDDAIADGDEEDDWADTPLLTSTWEAISSGNTDALDRLLDSSDLTVSSRAADGRGLAFWAYEFQSVYALASINAFGGDMLKPIKDSGGETPMDMCKKNSDCNLDELTAKAKAMVDDLIAKKEQRKKQREQEDDELDDEELGDDEF